MSLTSASQQTLANTSGRVTHLEFQECGPAGLADAAAVPSVRRAAAVAAAALDQQAAGEEDGVGGPQLLPQVDRVVVGGAAVSLDVVVEAVEVNWIWS